MLTQFKKCIKLGLSVFAAFGALIGVLFPGIATAGANREIESPQALNRSLQQLSNPAGSTACDDQIVALAELGLIQGSFAGCISQSDDSDWLMSNLNYRPDNAWGGGIINIHHKPGHYDNGGGNGCANGCNDNSNSGNDGNNGGGKKT